ncbi:YkvA family protein [Chthonobacter rhizosphaerae]|uniref:YkvA family protein n=1 Tax=Chthonobacter rhizosphaerae TaxID=2735553 RepID=UPI0015EFCA68|nr:YkvA family protein [Chthonobacter rhizosphaerae]
MATRHYDDPEIIGPEGERETRVRRDFWRVAKKAARSIPLFDEVVAAYYCALDPKTPTRVRATLLAALAYFVVPFDVVPDFLLGLGFTDDVTVLAAAIAMVRSNITEEHRQAAREALKDDARKV